MTKNAYSIFWTPFDSIINFTNELSYQQYNDDFKLRLALIKLLEIIGEAANGISDETQGRFSEVEFASIVTIYQLAPDNAVIGH